MEWQTAMSNWLQIYLVASARPDDVAAQDTVDFFASILREDFAITDLQVISYEQDVVRVSFLQANQPQQHEFPASVAEQLLTAIEREPRYGQ